jgi:phosphoglycolate phosphatase-like HAD superfamily hydrolase
VLRLLALDFDGVISDSAPEAFVVALRTYAELRPDSGLAALARQLGGDRAPTMGAVRGSDSYAAFLEIMPLGNRAEDYAVGLSAVDAGRAVPDQEAYDALHAEHDPAWLREYHARFYRVRHALAESDSGGWRALMGPYPRFVALLRRCSGRVILAIATAKDRRSVNALLRAYGIDDLFDDERVLDKEAGVSKSVHLQLLQDRFDCAYEQIAFLDDKINHLDDVAKLGVRCGLACWGYNGEREVRLARERGYLVCRLDDVEAQLFS